MRERLKRAVLKTAIPERVSGVQIPLPPPDNSWVPSTAPGISAAAPAARTPAKRLNLKTRYPKGYRGSNHLPRRATRFLSQSGVPALHVWWKSRIGQLEIVIHPRLVFLLH